MAGVYKEVWTGEIIRAFTHKETFLDGVIDASDKVQNDVIHLAEIGGKPTVLINNTLYPLTPEQLQDKDLPISLNKYETAPTAVSKDELFAISYNKMSNVISLHKESLVEKSSDHAAYSIAPFKETSEVPLIKSTGGDNGKGGQMLTVKDVIRLKGAYDDLGIPAKGRRLVLSPQHVMDLLMQSQVFEKQYQNIQTGQVLNMYGFDIREYLKMPTYTIAFEKKAFGAVAEDSDRAASFSFYTKRVFKAKGSTDMSYSEKEKDPINKRNLVSFDQRFVALPLVQKGLGAIVTGG